MPIHNACVSLLPTDLDRRLAKFEIQHCFSRFHAALPQVFWVETTSGLLQPKTKHDFILVQPTS
jgi:hypothetical protein